MTTDPVNNDTKILQATVDHFICLQILLELLATKTATVKRWIKKDTLILAFDQDTGRLVNVSRESSGDNDEACEREKYAEASEPLIMDNQHFTKDMCDRLAEYLVEFHNRRQSLLKCLEELPAEVHALLTDLRGRNWRLFVCRNWILPLENWPTLSSREHWRPHQIVSPKRVPFPTRVDDLLEYWQDTDPTEEWQALCKESTSYIDDIIAAAHELNADVGAHKDGPYGIDQWCHNDHITNSKMTITQAKLAKYLWQHLGKKVQISDLIGKNRLFENVQEATISRHGSSISEFFVDQLIPLVVSSGDRMIWMEHNKTEE